MKEDSSSERYTSDKDKVPVVDGLVENPSHLIVLLVGVSQQVTGLDGIRDNQKGLGAKAQFVWRSVIFEVILETDKHGSVGNVVELSFCEGATIHTRVASVELFNVGTEDIGGVTKDDVLSLFSLLHYVEFPYQIPPPRQAFGVGIDFRRGSSSGSIGGLGFVSLQGRPDRRSGGGGWDDSPYLGWSHESTRGLRQEKKGQQAELHVFRFFRSVDGGSWQ